GGALRHPRRVRVGAVSCDHRHLGMRPQPRGDGLRQAILEEIDRAAAFEIDDDLAIATALAVRPVVDANHVWGWWRSGLVGTDPPRPGLAAAREALPCELAGARRPTQHQAGVTLRLARPGGGVRIGAGHGRHPFSEGLSTTRRGVAKKA